MTTAKRLQQLSDRHVQQRDGILEKLLALIFGLWTDFDAWDDRDVVNGMVARSAKLALDAAAKNRRAQRVYLTTVLDDMGVSTRDIPPPLEAYPRSGVTPIEVYRRPVDDFIFRRRNGSTLAESEEAFQQRMRAIAEADMRAAERDEAEDIFRAVPPVLFYRRIIHPEMSESGVCGLCVVASQNRYGSRDLLPLHGGCKCDVAPVTEGNDPGLALNKDDLRRIYAAASASGQLGDGVRRFGTMADELREVRVVVREHGELGPILVKEGDHFRTAEEAGRTPYLKPDAVETRKQRERELGALRESIASAETRYADYVAANPQSLEPTSGNYERVRLFRSIKQQREYAASLENWLRTNT